MYVYDLHTMKREESVSSPFSVALGNFDGVHLGHAELIKKCVSYAKENGIASAVWTFADNAGELPNKPGVPYITPVSAKLEIIASFGVDYAILEDFSEIRGLSPESFVRERLIKKYGAVCAVCGYNFRFGAGGSGNSEMLTELMKPHDCIVVPPFYCGDIPASSTAVRRFIESGDTASARKLLGRPFFIDSPVVHGKKLGRSIGIPTVNQFFEKGQLVPSRGIYATVVSFDGQHYRGVTNVGIRPTVDGECGAVNCETHILDYDGCLYGKSVRVWFIDKLRDEHRFSDIGELTAQIRRDIGEAQLCLTSESCPEFSFSSSREV